MGPVIVGERYDSKIASEKFDAIIIGSGLSGLTVASLLSRQGKRVLVLEKHYTAGGFTHMFKRGEFAWDVGVHYVGDVHVKGTSFQKMFEYLSDGKLEWCALDQVYDRVFINGEQFEFKAGVENFRSMLYARFPKEHTAIDQYLKLIRKVNRASSLFFAEKALPPFLSKILYPFLSRGFRKYSKLTTKEVLDSLTDNLLLKAVLAAQFGDYALTPSESSFGVQALLASHFLKGGAYPKGGAVNFARTIIPSIEKAQGHVMVRMGVEEIMVEEGRAQGVRLSNGDILKSQIIVSTVGVDITFNKLLSTSIRSKINSQIKLPSVRPSIGHLCLYLGLDGDAKELNLPRCNMWIYPGPDHDQNFATYYNDAKAPLPLTYISFPGSKDEEWRQNNPGKCTVEMITMAPFEWFQDWENKPWHKRGEDYEKLKADFTQRLIQIFEEYIPQARGRIIFKELSTPLSTKYFCQYQKGEIYGIDHTPARFEQRWLRAHTPIKGLYLSGQDVVAVGIGSAAASGVLTASAILKRNLLTEVEQGCSK